MTAFVDQGARARSQGPAAAAFCCPSLAPPAAAVRSGIRHKPSLHIAPPTTRAFFALRAPRRPGAAARRLAASYRQPTTARAPRTRNKQTKKVLCCAVKTNTPGPLYCPMSHPPRAPHPRHMVTPLRPTQLQPHTCADRLPATTCAPVICKHRLRCSHLHLGAFALSAGPHQRTAARAQRDLAAPVAAVRQHVVVLATTMPGRGHHPGKGVG